MAKETGILIDEATEDMLIVVSLDESGKIAEGLQLGDVTNQNINTILKSQPGEIKESPTVGVGIDNIILDHDYLLYKHKVRQQLDAEGMQVNHLKIDGQEIEINANYK